MSGNNASAFTNRFFADCCKKERFATVVEIYSVARFIGFCFIERNKSVIFKNFNRFGYGFSFGFG